MKINEGVGENYWKDNIFWRYTSISFGIYVSQFASIDKASVYLAEVFVFIVGTEPMATVNQHLLSSEEADTFYTTL